MDVISKHYRAQKLVLLADSVSGEGGSIFKTIDTGVKLSRVDIGAI